MSDEINKKASKIFIPKVPIKKESIQPSNTTEINKSVIKEVETNTQIKNKKNHIKTKYNNHNHHNNRQDDKSKINNLENKGRHWTMPSTGTGFFFGTNNNNKLLAKNNVYNSNDINSDNKLQSIKSDNNAVKISRPNENIRTTIESNFNKVDFIPNYNYNSLMKSNIDSDSDIDVNESQDNYNIDHSSSMEIWPPVSYDPQAPLALPLGPKSENLHNLFANEPILSDPNDYLGIEREEMHGLFVIQMPSDLKFDTLQIDNNNILDQNIGKLQLMKSGKVRLITKNGKIFEVNAGMNSSFAQILSGVEINSPDNKGEVVNNQNNTNIQLDNNTYEINGNNNNTIFKQESSNSKSNNNNNNNNNKQINSLNLLGSITKKLVITPSYDIGERKTRAFSMSANSQTIDNNKSNVSYRLRSPSEIATSTEIFNNNNTNVSSNMHSYNQEEIVYMETDIDETFI